MPTARAVPGGSAGTGRPGQKAFIAQLKNDYKSVIYKENRDDWRKAEIVVTTVQSLLFNDKYQRLFSPTDFDLVISDEAHRSIGGNARAVFDYFVGYKLGLTATPRDYLKKFDATGSWKKRQHPRPARAERRLLLDTYRTFGCEDGQPTFRYSLLDGVKRWLSHQSGGGRRPHRHHHTTALRSGLSPSPCHRRWRRTEQESFKPARVREAFFSEPPISSSARPS
jgi:hypothetical protein